MGLQSFDQAMFATLAAPIDGVPEPTVLVGCTLAAAISASKFQKPTPHCDIFREACDGMCVSNMMREAGVAAFQVASKLSSDPQVNAELHKGFADACGVPVAELSLYVKVWDAMQLS